MPRLVVDQAGDPRIADYRNVPDAELLEARGLFVAEGRLVVRRMLTGRRFSTRSVMVTPAALPSIEDVLADFPIFVVSQAVMDGITGFNIHRGCLAIGERGRARQPADVAADARRLLLLERVANADNVGGLFRNAAAFGVDGVILDRTTTDPLYRKAIRTSVATALHVPFARATDWPEMLDTLARSGFTLVALTPAAGAAPLHTSAASLRTARVALIVGHEGEGLSDATLARCHLHVRIPMTGDVDSLNVAVAAGIAMYEVWMVDRG